MCVNDIYLDLVSSLCLSRRCWWRTPTSRPTGSRGTTGAHQPTAYHGLRETLGRSLLFLCFMHVVIKIFSGIEKTLITKSEFLKKLPFHFFVREVMSKGQIHFG